jgi:hypothetical protein
MLEEFTKILVAAIVAVLPAAAQTAGQQALKPVTVADTIEMTTSGAGSSFTGAMLEEAALFSPDGGKFAFVTQKGDLKKDGIAYSIWVYETASALRSPKPRLVATLESSSNRPAISGLKWLPDNETLVFMGEQPGELPQVYKVKVGGKLERVTNEVNEISEFSMDERGDAFVYLTELPRKPIFSEQELRRGFYVTPGRRWEDLYLNRKKFDGMKKLHVKSPHMRAPVEIAEPISVIAENSLTISPNGEYATVEGQNLHPPAGWDDYLPMFADSEIRFSSRKCLAGDVGSCPQTYLLIDLEDKSVRSVIDAPLFYSNIAREMAAWTKDNTVLLVSTLLPLTGATSQERNDRLHKVYAAVLDPVNGRVQPFEELKKPLAGSILKEIGGGQVASKSFERFEPVHIFSKEGGRWQIREVPAEQIEPKHPLSVKLEQGINEPPKLAAQDPHTGQKTILFDLNPQFAHMSFGHVEVLKWKGTDGNPNVGELYYPVGYVAGRRYPLILQTHGESRETFWIQGPFSTTNAAQPLANKGFFVLQMGMGDLNDKAGDQPWLEVFGTAEEAPFAVAEAEGAIDELDRRGLIDRNKVGYSGFSRTVYHGEYLLTHSSYPIAAAVLADGIDFGYVGCLYWPLTVSACEKMNGGVPWGAMANWEKNAPPERLDKVHTPLLMQSIMAPLGEWGIYAGLQWLKRPVELVNFYPQGEHELIRPQEKYLSEQSAVDWYSFWIKGEEDPDPAKAEQFARWRELRKLQENEAKAKALSN